GQLSRRSWTALARRGGDAITAPPRKLSYPTAFPAARSGHGAQLASAGRSKQKGLIGARCIWTASRRTTMRHARAGGVLWLVLILCNPANAQVAAEQRVVKVD